MLKLKKAQIQKKNKFSKVQKKPIGKIKKTGEKKPTEPYKKPVENEKTEEKKRRKTNSIATGPAQLDPALSGAIARSRVERRIGLGGPCQFDRGERRKCQFPCSTRPGPESSPLHSPVVTSPFHSVQTISPATPRDLLPPSAPAPPQKPDPIPRGDIPRSRLLRPSPILLLDLWSGSLPWPRPGASAPRSRRIQRFRPPPSGVARCFFRFIRGPTAQIGAVWVGIAARLGTDLGVPFGESAFGWVAYSVGFLIVIRSSLYCTLSVRLVS
jgi:hypothetical protein